MITQRIAECLESIYCINGGQLWQCVNYYWPDDAKHIVLDPYWVEGTLKVYMITNKHEFISTPSVEDDVLCVENLLPRSIIRVEYSYLRLTEH